jgi:large subunit ribosomal protein L28
MPMCQICGKGTVFGHQVSHANNRNRRTFKPNLQRVHVLHHGRKMHLTVCTRCIKSGRVQKAI